MASRVKRNILALLEDAVHPYEVDTNPENFEALTFEYHKLLMQDKENSWQRADLAHLAAATYGKLRRLADETGESYAMLKQLSYCSKQYDQRMRSQFSKLSFGHFRVVAHLEERYVLLQKAQQLGWGVDRLRQEVSKNITEYIPIKRVVRNLNSKKKRDLNGMDALSLLNLALGTSGKITWTGSKFVLERP